MTFLPAPAAYADSVEQPAEARLPCDQKLLHFDVEMIAGPQGNKVFTKVLYRPMTANEKPEEYTYVMQSVTEQDKPFSVKVIEWRCPL